MKSLIAAIIIILSLTMAYNHGKNVESGKVGLTLEQVYSTIN